MGSGLVTSIYAPFAKALVRHDQVAYNDAYEEGFDAFEHNAAQEDNPYDGELGKAWDAGWSDARDGER